MNVIGRISSKVGGWPIKMFTTECSARQTRVFLDVRNSKSCTKAAYMRTFFPSVYWIAKCWHAIGRHLCVNRYASIKNCCWKHRYRVECSLQYWPSARRASADHAGVPPRVHAGHVCRCRKCCFAHLFIVSDVSFIEKFACFVCNTCCKCVEIVQTSPKNPKR